MSYKTSFVKHRADRKYLKANRFLDEMNKVIPWNGWFNLSYPAMEESIYDRISFQRFLDIDIVSDNIPDETTILNFRHFLEEYKIQEKLFKKINRILKEHGLIMREGTIVDATLILY